MPLTINVGLNRKASKDYQSTGASINLTAELDQSLLTRPDELQGAVSELYEQAELALDRQANGDSREAPPRLARSARMDPTATAEVMGKPRTAGA
ncbi:MAG: hypothetical protein ACPGYV_03860 [Phycisphaeraceae bacterium]